MLHVASTPVSEAYALQERKKSVKKNDVEKNKREPQAFAWLVVAAGDCTNLLGIQPTLALYTQAGSLLVKHSCPQLRSQDSGVLKSWTKKALCTCCIRPKRERITVHTQIPPFESCTKGRQNSKHQILWYPRGSMFLYKFIIVTTLIFVVSYWLYNLFIHICVSTCTIHGWCDNFHTLLSGPCLEQGWGTSRPGAI